MQRLAIPTQIDLIDYMLSHHGEVPVLDRSYSDQSISSEQLHVEGIDAPEEEIEDENELDEAYLHAFKPNFKAN
ncbi:MAG: hypothetical protein CMM93_06205 [Rickettsiales bacterium]|nr:hypothetical protein [Rickettsiales bacterium]|tara:strand:- start:176 stop:397 length:222 start_codon:yes stop_codon:yes gene_type:complete